MFNNDESRKGSGAMSQTNPVILMTWYIENRLASLVIVKAQHLNKHIQSLRVWETP